LSHIILMTHPPQQWPAVTAALRATHTGRGRAVVDATSAYLFGQESFSYMDQEGIRHFLRDCDREYLLTMLNRLDPVTRGNVFACMARRAALMTYEDLDLMAPPTFADREEARRVIGDIVRALIEDGKVILRDDVDRLLDEFDELLRDDGEGP